MLHYENLQLYLRLGLKQKNPFVFEFNQSQWSNPYIEFCMQKRIEAKTNGVRHGRVLYK